jgi:hypothetical protein
MGKSPVLLERCFQVGSALKAEDVESRSARSGRIKINLSLVTFQGTELEHIANELIAKTREKCISDSKLAESSPNPPSAPRLQGSAATRSRDALRENGCFFCTRFGYG